MRDRERCPACGEKAIDPGSPMSRQTRTTCPSCAASLQRPARWLGTLSAGMGAMLSIGVLNGVRPFERGAGWGRILLALALMGAVLFLAFWATHRLTNGWHVKGRPLPLRPGHKLAAVALVLACAAVAVGGLSLRSYREGASFPFAAPAGMGGIGEYYRNRTLRGQLWEAGDQAAGVVRQMVVDAAFPGESVSTMLDAEGNAITVWQQQGMVLSKGPPERAEAARELCRLADRLQAHFRPLPLWPAGFPYPPERHARFHVLTADGVRFAEAPIAALASGEHPLAALWPLALKVRHPSSWVPGNRSAPQAR